MFLRAHTPPPRAGARSGVFVRWDAAHFIVRYAERPVTATGFGVYVAPDAIDEVARSGSTESRTSCASRSSAISGSSRSAPPTFKTFGSTVRVRCWERSAGTPSTSSACRWPAAVVPVRARRMPASPHVEHLMPRFASTDAGGGLSAVPARLVALRDRRRRGRARARASRTRPFGCVPHCGFAASRSCTKPGRVRDRTAHSSFARRCRPVIAGRTSRRTRMQDFRSGEGAPADIAIPEQAVRAGTCSRSLTGSASLENLVRRRRAFVDSFVHEPVKARRPPVRNVLRKRYAAPDLTTETRWRRGRLVEAVQDQPVRRVRLRSARGTYTGVAGRSQPRA